MVLREIFLPTYVVWFIDYITNVENSLKEFNWFVTSLQLDFINNNYTYKFVYIQPARSSFFKNNLCTGNTALEFIVTVWIQQQMYSFFPLSCMDKNTCVSRFRDKWIVPRI